MTFWRIWRICLTAFIDCRHPKGIPASPPNSVDRAGLWTIHTVPIQGKNGVWGRPDSHENTVIHENSGCGISCRQCLKIIPFTHAACLRLYWIRRRGFVLYGTYPMRIWGAHKNSWIQNRESKSGPIRITLVQFVDPDYVIWCHWHRGEICHRY
jgi:hypothetical protein